MWKPLPYLVIFAVCANSSCTAGELGAAANRATIYQEIEASSGQKSFLTGDFNRDGHSDLIVAGAAHDRIEVFLNDGAGVLSRDADYPAGERPSWLTALDFNNDGNTDLAIANHETNSITLLRGNGRASFEGLRPMHVPIVTQPHSHMIQAADLDNDGTLDLVVDSRDQFGIYVLRGKAGEGFDAPGRSVDVGGAPYLGFAVSDFNNDGKQDIITPNQNDLSVMLNRTSTEFTFERATLIPFRAPFAVGAADVNGDGNMDLVVASQDEIPGIVTFIGDGDGSFVRAASTPIGSGAKLVSTGDVNADGISDAVITSWNSEIVLLVGSADDMSSIQLPASGIRNPWGSALGDFNNDGRDEIIVGDASSQRVNIYTIEDPDQ